MCLIISSKAMLLLEKRAELKGLSFCGIRHVNIELRRRDAYHAMREPSMAPQTPSTLRSISLSPVSRTQPPGRSQAVRRDLQFQYVIHAQLPY